MPTDESTRLRIRQYLIELMDEEAADAMMESMPPIPWTALATKDDIAALGSRVDGLDERTARIEVRIEELTTRFDTRLDEMTTRFDTRLDEMTTRFAVRLDGIGARIDSLARTVSIGALTLTFTVAIFVVATLVAAAGP